MIQPASTVPGRLVKDYLRSQGLSPEIIEWKYFDTTFNRGRERGFVWMHNDRVRGFLGFVPFVLGHGDRTWDAMWLCEWSREPVEGVRGVGRKLIIEAMRYFDHLIGFGGTSIARRLHPQIATRTFVDAGIVLHRPLRLGALFKKIDRLVPFFGLAGRRGLGGIPLPGAPRKSSQRLVRIETGVPRAIESLLTNDRGGGWCPRYDLDYLNWQLVRCPVLTCGTCYIPGDSGARAAVVFWRPDTSADFWRVALWPRDGASDELRTVLVGMLHRLYKCGAMAVSMIASRLDTELMDLVKSNGFRPSRHRIPLFIYAGRDTDESVGQVSRLSYLDGDLGYRFRGPSCADE